MAREEAQRYVVALKQGWIFRQPFEVYPIEGTEPFVAEAPPTTSEDDVAEAVQFIVQSIRKTGDEAPPTRQD